MTDEVQVQAQVEDNKKEVLEQPKEEVVATAETQQEINWKKFREGREQDRKEKELARREKEAAERREKDRIAEANALRAALEATLAKPTQEPQEEDIIQKRVDEALERRDREAEKKRVEREQEELPQKLKQAFNDFNDVCTKENLDYLEFHFPEIAKPCTYMGDSFEKWSLIYNAVKKHLPNHKNKNDQSRIESNAKKPQSMAGGLSQTGDGAPTLSLDDDRKKANYARMLKVLKGG